MNCEFYLNLISGHIDAVNTKSEEEQLQKHIKSCEHCRALLETMKANDVKLKSSKVHAPADLTARIMSEVRKTPVKRSKKPFYISMAASGLAAAAVLAIVLSGNGGLPAKMTDEAAPELNHAKRKIDKTTVNAEYVEENTYLPISGQITENTDAYGFYGVSEDSVQGLLDKSTASTKVPVLLIYAEYEDIEFSGEKIPLHELQEIFKNTDYNLNGMENGIYLVTWEELQRIATKYDGIFEMEKYYAEDKNYITAAVVFAE